MIRVLLVDEQPIVRLGLKSLLLNHPGLEISGEANNGVEALQLCEKMKPDVVILGLTLPDINGMEVLRQIRDSHPQIRVIIFSAYKDDLCAAEAFRLSAAGYILKTEEISDLVEAVHRALIKGERYLSPSISPEAIHLYLQGISEKEKSPYERLTPRERLILQMTAYGSSSHEIAKRLKISERTVEAHQANYMRKLNLHKQSELVRFAMRYGIPTKS